MFLVWQHWYYYDNIALHLPGEKPAIRDRAFTTCFALQLQPCKLKGSFLLEGRKLPGDRLLPSGAEPLKSVLFLFSPLQISLPLPGRFDVFYMLCIYGALLFYTVRHFVRHFVRHSEEKWDKSIQMYSYLLSFKIFPCCLCTEFRVPKGANIKNSK